MTAVIIVGQVCHRMARYATLCPLGRISVAEFIDITIQRTFDFLITMIYKPLMFSSPFTSQFAFTCVAEGDVTYELQPAERAILHAHASDQRRREFLLGRAAASAVLKQIGLSSPPPVLRDEGRAPLWPKGFVGSITHTWAGSDRLIAAAVVAKRNIAKGIGIDLQWLARPLTASIEKRICTPNELIALSKLDGDERHVQTLILFSAKESIYKALRPLVGRYIGFQAVEFSERRSDLLRGTLLVDLPGFAKGSILEIGYRTNDEFVLSYLMTV